MPSHSDWAVQKAVYSRLAATPEVTLLLAQGAASVHDHVPTGSLFPYIVIGEMDSKPFEAAAAGGREILLTLHIFSKQAGFKETRNIQAALANALHDADFAVTGQHLVLCLETESTTVLEADGKTRHGVARFRIITEPSA